MMDLNRLRWDCRRGMLELDIVLAKFLERHVGCLSPLEVDAFRGLLAHSDPDLWGMIQSDKSSRDDNLKKVLQLLRQC